jgi:PKD repeat protein
MKKRSHVYIICVIVTFLVSCLFTAEIGAQSQEMLEKQLQTAKEKYDYANWEAETGIVTAGLNISPAILPQLQGMSKKWQKDNFRIETIQDTPCANLRQWWASDDRQLQITMVVCPTFTAAKEYLISYYANTQMAPLVPKPTGRELGLDIGNICYAAPAGQGGGFLAVDFIRHNVVIMMRAEGNSRKELAAAARTLDGLLLNKEAKGDYRGLQEIPVITRFSSKKAAIELGERVLLDLEVNNPSGGELVYSWDISGGGVKKNLKGNFVYYGGEPGTHTITVTVINDLGLYDSRSLKIEVVK